MKKKKENNLKVILIALFAILVIILIGIMYFFNNPNVKQLQHLQYINSSEIEIGTKSLIDQHLWYKKYNGQLSASVVDKSLYYFSTELVPEYLKTTDLYKYYDENAFKIKVDLGITDKEDFSQLVKSLKEIENTSMEIEKYFLVEESVSTNTDGIEFVVALQYKGAEPILVRIFVNNEQQKECSSVKYTAETSEKYKVERKDTKIDTSEDTNRSGRAL